MENPKISIIIPTYFSPSIQETITAITRQTSIGLIQEVIIAGKQEDLSLPENSKFRYIQVVDNPTPANNRNTGASLSKGDWLCFLDSDCIPNDDWLKIMGNKLNHSENIFVGSIDINPGMPYWSWCDHLLSFGDQVYGIYRGQFLKYAATNNLMVSKKLFQDIGGFDDTFTKAAGEDYQFCAQAINLGQRITYIDEAVVIHNHKRMSFYSSWKHLFLFGESTIQRRMMQKELSIPHKLGYSLLKIRLLGEILGIIRILWRTFYRPIHRPRLLKFWRYFPGMFILDFAHTLGMIHKLRNYS